MTRSTDPSKKSFTPPKKKKKIHDKAVQSIVLWLNLNKIGAVSIFVFTIKTPPPHGLFQYMIHWFGELLLVYIEVVWTGLVFVMFTHSWWGEGWPFAAYDCCPVLKWWPVLGANVASSQQLLPDSEVQMQVDHWCWTVLPNLCFSNFMTVPLS